MQQEVSRGFRLSPQQQRLWRLQQGPAALAHTSRCALSITGHLDRELLAGALAAVVARHESLRTMFSLLPGMSEPLQAVGAARPPRLREEDLRGLVAAEQGRAVEDRFAAIGRDPFDLAGGDLLRAHLLSLGDGEHVLLLALPTLCADEASLRNLAAEVSAACGNRPFGEPPMQHIDFAAWQNEILELPEHAEEVLRWRELWRSWEVDRRLAERFPGELGESAGVPFEPRSVDVAVSQETARALGALARECECPVEVLGLLAWQVVLAASTGQQDVLVGVLHEGRRYEELQGLVGLLGRYLPLVLRQEGSARAREAVVRLCGELAAAADLQEYFSWQQAGSRHGDAAEPVFFPYCFAAAPPWDADGQGGLRVSLIRQLAPIDRYKLELSWGHRSGEPRLELRYDSRRFDRDVAERIAERIAAVLRSLARRPEARIEELDVLGERERRRLGELAVVPGRAPEACLHRLFEEQAERTPDRVAIVCAGRSLSYGALNAAANQLARHLRGLGVGVEMPVAIALDRSPEMAVAVLAALKAGGAWVPLDPTHPADHLAFLLADTRAPVLITRERLLGSLRPEAARVICLDAMAPELAAARSGNLGGGALPGSLAYVIYTSGSTGRSKGVQVEHRAPVALFAALRERVFDRHAGPGSPLRVSLNAPLAFDASVQQLVQLLGGHTLDIVPEEVRADGAALLAHLREHQIEQLDCTPSHLRLLVAAGLLQEDGPLPEIVLTAGEAIDEALWSALGRSSRMRFYNLYGPTECTVDATARRIDANTGPPSIGRPLAGYEVYLLGPDLRPVPFGAPGEICLGGGGLARGYLGRPDLSAERFVPHPFGGRPGGRLYRTGDLARHLPDGEIEFIGRVDQQVKIRGHRIEPGEIEAALAAHRWVHEAVVAGRRDGTGQVVLAAYVVPSADAPAGFAGGHAELQRFLAERLPPYMVPAAFVPLATLPLTPSGKVDRRALPDPDAGRPDLAAPYAAPRDALEAALAEVWARSLGVEPIGIDDSFFSLGGDSIRSLQVQTLAREKRLTFSVQDLFQHQTIRELAMVLRERDAAETAALDEASTQPFELVPPADLERMPEGIEDAFPVTRLQAGMLFHTELNPESGLYQDIISFSVRARLDLPALEAAVARLVERHSALRTGFHLSGFGEPLQLVHRTARVAIEVHDLRGLSDDGQKRALAEVMEAEKVRPFDWRQPPLLRIAIHLRAEERFQLTLTEHHSLLDGWSVARLLTELFNLYVRGPAALAAAPPAPAAFRNYVALERQALASAEARAYWQRALEGASWVRLPRWPATLEGDATLRHEVRGLQIPDDVSASLRDLARRASVPLKSVLLAVHLKVIGLLIGHTDVLTGISSDGRPEAPGSDHALGIFVSMLPFRLHLRPGTRLDLVQQVFAAERELLPFRRFPLAEIQRMHGNDMLFEAAFNFVHFHVYQEIEQASGVGVEGELGFERLEVPLTVNFAIDPHSSRLDLSLNYHLNVLTREQIEAVAGYYRRALEAIGSGPEGDHEAVALLSPAEREHLLSAGQPSPQPLVPPDRRVHTLFAEQAARTPGALAVVAATERLTYAELDARAGRIARRLQALGIGPEARVGIRGRRSPATVAAILGALEAGAAWIPLDPGYPEERLSFMIEDSRPAVLLATDGEADALPQEEGGLSRTAGRKPAAAVAPGNLAYVIYTSGSTGRPKGVMVPHAGLGNLAAAQIDLFDVRPGDRVLQFASPSFDASVSEILVALLVGAELHLGEGEELLPGPKLLALLRERRITHLTLPPSVLAVLPEAELPDLRVLVVAGEACPPQVVERWAARVRLINAYGPTEATVCATATPLVSLAAGGRPSIGRPIPGARVRVADSRGDLVPLGVPGEILLGGIGLARGYLDRPDLTAEKLVPDPEPPSPGERLYRTGDLGRWRPDGTLDFLGRIDHQVKVRGFRIETAEIEAQLARHPQVRAAAVLAHDEAPGDRRLVAYLVLADPKAGGTHEVDPAMTAELRGWLSRWLPEHMLPNAFLALDELPLTASGKVDRRALPAPERLRLDLRPTYVAPRGPVEEQLAAIWAEVLSLDKVGAQDDFLDLGGHSLVAIQLITRAREVFGVELPLRLVFAASTVAAQAVAVVRAQAEKADQAELERMLAQLDQLSEEEAQLLLADGKPAKEARHD